MRMLESIQEMMSYQNPGLSGPFPNGIALGNEKVMDVMELNGTTQTKRRPAGIVNIISCQN